MTETKLLAYVSIIRPMLEYADVIWDPPTKLSSDVLEAVPITDCIQSRQFCSIQIICVSFDRQDTTSESIFHKLNLPSFMGLFRETVVLRHFWTSDFKTPDIQQRPMRPSRGFDIPRIRTKYGQRTRMYCVPQIFNNLPDNILHFTSKQKLNKSL